MKRSVLYCLLLVLLAGAAGCDAADDSDADALEEARARWTASGPSSYRFDYTRVCYCSPSNLSATVYVRQDTVWTFENPRGDGNEPIDAGEYDLTRRHFLTVDELFERIAEYARDGRAGRLEYDDERGYPTAASVGASEEMADSGISYRLSDLRATD